MTDIIKKKYPVWFDGSGINESRFCDEFLQNRALLHTEGAFFTPEGCLTDETPLMEEIFSLIRNYASCGVSRKIRSIIDLLAIMSHEPDFAPCEDRINLANGTLYLDGSFDSSMNTAVRSRFPVAYNPAAKRPEVFLRYIHELLNEDDIPTLQEYMGYCLIPTNKGQRMLLIKGSGGEGKSQLGTVLKHLFGCNAKDGSIGKISDNSFARADLEHVHLLIDDDMRMEALKQTNYVKSIVTANGRMDLEKKGRQSYQGYMYCRLIAFSNGDLQSLYDRSDGFYRRQLILTAKDRPLDRVTDPYIADKMIKELEGIFLWALAGLKRLIANDYRFTESSRAVFSREALRSDANNALMFMEASDYVRLEKGYSSTSKELYSVYCLWCDENGLLPMKSRSFAEFLIGRASCYGLNRTNNVKNADGRRVFGFEGIRILADTGMRGRNGFTPIYRDFSNPFQD